MSETKRCRVCGTPTEVRRENYKYDASGLDNITLENIEVRHCPKCGERQALIPTRRGPRDCVPVREHERSAADGKADREVASADGHLAEANPELPA